MRAASSVRFIQIEQALYGDYHGGHALLASSGDEAVSKGIVQRLDLPDTAPPGVEWSPFLRGFPYGDKYVLSRTFQDTRASRGGMVFSHALLAPRDGIAETKDLEPLLRLLASSDRQRPDAKTLHVACSEVRVPPANDLIDTAEALGGNGRLPAVRLGHIGFDDLVIALWAHLLPGIRREFAFRLSFDPRDLIEEPKPTLVCTPPGMAGRWSGYQVIRSAKCREPSSLAAAILTGHGKADPVIEFMHEMGVKPASFSELRLVEQAYRLDISEPTLERRVGVIRLIQKLSPDSDAGKIGKDRLVRRLCDVLSAARAGAVLLLRNVGLTAYPSPNPLWKALEGWVAANSYAQDQDVEMLSVLEDATTSDAAVQEWRDAIRNGLATAARSARSCFPRAFWRWLEVRPEVVTALFPHVPPEAGTEERLASATPRDLDPTAAEKLRTLALSREWFRLHGAVLSASCSTSDSARRQVAVDTSFSFLEGLRFALRRAEPEELVECALEIEDPRMPRFAGEAAAKAPDILADVDFTATRAQAIWREALAVDPEAWRGPADPAAALHSILDGLLDGEETDQILIERLSDSPVADLGKYPRRSEIWSRTRNVARDHLLLATASGWVRQAASSKVPFFPEDEMQAAILESDELEQTLDALIPNRIGAAVGIIAALSRYDERQFLRLLRESTSRTTSLAVPDAEAIGRLVSERRWADVAADLIRQFKSGRRDLKSALRTCCDMLDSWDRFLFGLAPVSASDKWQKFYELAVELYPSGPDEDELWERAGGDDADLSTGSNGRTRWRRAVRNIRNGKGPTRFALLAAMMSDYPNNERIRYLAESRVFGDVVDSA